MMNESANAPAGRLRESEIRPADLMARQAAYFEADVARLRVRAEEFVEVRCPACGSGDRFPRFEKSGFSYVTCEACGTLYLTPRPTPAVLHDYYRTSDNYRFWAEHIFPASEDARRERIFRPRVERIVAFCERYGTGRNLLIEVGAGFGTFCQELSRAGIFGKVLAVEPTPDLAARCRERGIDVIERPIEEVDTNDLPPADVIASFETIEHLFDPGAFIAACERNLRPGGLLVLSCPNGRGFDVVVLEERSDTVDAEHLNCFTPSSLTQLVERYGLEVLEVMTPGQLDVDLVRRAVETGAWDSRSSPFLHQVLVEEGDRLADAFQSFLAEHQLSSHLWLVARRPATAG